MILMEYRVGGSREKVSRAGKNHTEGLMSRQDVFNRIIPGFVNERNMKKRFSTKVKKWVSDDLNSLNAVNS